MNCIAWEYLQQCTASNPQESILFQTTCELYQLSSCKVSQGIIILREFYSKNTKYQCKILIKNKTKRWASANMIWTFLSLLHTHNMAKAAWWQKALRSLLWFKGLCKLRYWQDCVAVHTSKLKVLVIIEHTEKKAEEHLHAQV